MEIILTVLAVILVPLLCFYFYYLGARNEARWWAKKWEAQDE